MNYSFGEMEDHILKLCDTEKGFFVDIGAHDGISGSNTKRLEELGWEGICVEPLPRAFEELQKNRTCELQNCAIWDKEGTTEFLVVTGYAEMLSGIVESYDPRHADRIDRELQHFGGTKTSITVRTRRFDNVVKNPRIDFLSIDTEGSELSILNTINFDKYDIRVICVENNFGDPAFEVFFANRGYRLDKVFSNCDQIFVKVEDVFSSLQGFEMDDPKDMPNE